MNARAYYEDIITARATPPGSSALAVIRVSGKNCWQILEKIFQPTLKTPQFRSHQAYYGKICDQAAVIDHVVVLLFADQSGFTGEESFEINCHGSEVIVSLIIKLLCSQGIRLAEPGEFSKRAFLNGKIDLSEAEAIMDIVHAATRRSALIAVRQLEGGIRDRINRIKNQLADLLAAIEVYIDYPEEELDLDISKWSQTITRLSQPMEQLLKGFERGKILRQGIRAVILGRTNSGKSTLFNFLLNEDKAIVSDIHGTTRDYIDAVININGYGIRLYDTAGLRNSNDPIEIEGTKRAKNLSQTSDLIIYMISRETGFTPQDESNLRELKEDKKVLLIINKVDILPEPAHQLQAELKQFLSRINIHSKIVQMSALNRAGLDQFNQKLLELIIDQKTPDSEDPVITNQRHAMLIEKAIFNLKQARQKLEEQILDLAAFELREGLDYLGEISGEISPAEIIDRIFARFCVGK